MTKIKPGPRYLFWLIMTAREGDEARLGAAFARRDHHGRCTRDSPRLKCSWQHTTSTGTSLDQSFEYCAAIETEAGKSEADAGLQYAQSIFNTTPEING